MTLDSTKERKFLAHHRLMRDTLERIHQLAIDENIGTSTAIQAIANLAEAALTGKRTVFLPDGRPVHRSDFK